MFLVGGLNNGGGGLYMRKVVGEDEGIISKRDEGLFKPAYMHVHWTVYSKGLGTITLILCSCIIHCN
jgi:hypothetical protein